MAYRQQQKYSQAEEICGKLLEPGRSASSHEDLHTASAGVELALGYQAQKQFLKAEPLFLEGYNGFTRSVSQPVLNPNGRWQPPASNEDLANLITQIVEFYQEWKKPDQAAEWQKKMPVMH